uniref:Ig-like domain-containing protein n=1 Tax=Sinocyclocheilus grahami TaxID=75366 RepID=A0A672QIW7_SINGR
IAWQPIKKKMDSIICFSVNSAIKQTPSDLLSKNKVESVTLHCSHTNPNFNYMYWYQQKSNDGSLELIGMLNYGTAYQEEKFQSRFNITGHAKEDAFLLISNINAEDSAVYFCAASDVNTGGVAYFGNGTKLTVLGDKPEVEILKPSGNETSCKQKVTLVCVAKNFYPDHVSITWKIGSKDINDDVATDPYATQDKETKLFSITSRLKVSKKEFKPQNTFRCTVRFYNETDVYTESASAINGIAGISLDIS